MTPQEETSPHASSVSVLALSLLVTHGYAVGQANKLSQVEQTEHFEIFYQPGSRAGAAVDRIAVLAERELRRICKQLGIEAGGKFKLYLYEDVAELTRLTGVKGSAGFSAGDSSHLPFDNDQTRYHEMVHIVAAQLLQKSGNERRNLFFAEGLANACLEFVHGIPVHAVAKYYKAKGALPAIQAMARPVDFYAWLRARAGFNAYDVAGSYVRFLLDHFGAKKTVRYYTGATAKAAFGHTAAQLEALWHKSLDDYSVRPELFALLEQRHGGAIGRLRALAKPAGLPKDLIGKVTDWQSLDRARLHHNEEARWRRDGGKIIGTSKVAKWTICELGKTTYGDCIIRATIRTPSPIPVQIRLGEGNQAMLVNGTFLYRKEAPVASSGAAVMDRNRTVTDFVLIRRAGKIQIWIDGRKILTTTADDTATPVGLGFHGGRVVFENVRVRRL